MTPADFGDDQLPQRYQLEYHFEHPPEVIWPYVADTDRVDRAIGLPTIDYQDEPSEQGGSVRKGAFKVAGLAMSWVESPYEWVQPHYMRVERDYLSGPLKRLCIHWEIEAVEKGCLLTQTFSYEPTNWAYNQVAKVELGIKTVGQFKKAYEQIDQFLSLRIPEPFARAASDEPVKDDDKRAQVSKKLQDLEVDGWLAERLAGLWMGGALHDVVSMRPFAIADQMNLDRVDVLYAFLRAAKHGFLDVSWDVACPSCRGPKLKAADLSSLEPLAHCDSCNIRYDAVLDESVELTFTVAPTLREAKLGEYCVGGPGNTPHYLAQVRIAPQEKRVIELRLEPDAYAVRSLQSNERWLLDVTEGTGAQVAPSFALSGNRGGDLVSQNVQLAAGRHEFRIANQAQHPVQFIIERQSWRTDVCSAAFVTSLQEFRDLFSSEVIRVGQEISIQSMALLFTDLKGSTALYGAIGDATAFARVREHFTILTEAVRKHQGAIVKTIGDAIMAAFTQPKNAVAAAIEIQRVLMTHNASKPEAERLTLKVGIHHGPCFAVNLNDRLDYFGTTVNVAARVEGQCAGHDIVMSHHTFDSSGVAEAVAQANLNPEHISRQLKGFDEEFALCRVDCLPLQKG